jgi:hypothetical protein
MEKLRKLEKIDKEVLNARFPFLRFTFFILFLLLSITGCKKDKPVVPQSAVNVFVVGITVNSNGNTVATIWKNGVATPLADASITSSATGISVVNGDTYVSGNIKYQPVYWKNGVLYPLGNYPRGSMASSIGINNGEVIVTGYTADYMSFAVAASWKNATLSPLAVDTTIDSYANTVTFDSGDIYISGWTSNEHNQFTAPVYWKNGSITSLTGLSKRNNVITDIAIFDHKVYAVGGTLDTSNSMKYVERALLWENGNLTVLDSSTNDSYATAVARSGSDVYVTGELNDNSAVYWKNGVVKVLSTGTGLIPSQANAIAIVGSDVYMAGKDGQAAVYWKNDKPVQLAKEGVAVGVMVVPR